MRARIKRPRNERQKPANWMVHLLVGSVVVGLVCFVTVDFALFRPDATPRAMIDPVLARADELIANLYCPCQGCGNSQFSQCDTGCGDHTSVRQFLLGHLRSGMDSATVLAHVKDRFGDLSTAASARKVGELVHPLPGATSAAASRPEELPFDVLRILEQKQRDR